MRNGIYRVLIAYDIVNDKRRVKFASLLNGYGYRVQKSCFECMITKKMYKKLLTEIDRFFNKEEDSIRVYLLNDLCKITNYGISMEHPYLDEMII